MSITDPAKRMSVKLVPHDVLWHCLYLWKWCR